MANEQNLNSPWEPGQSGNPKGKLKGTRNRSTIVREWLEARATQGEGQVVDQLVRALIQKAAQGDVAAFKELMDSGFGKLTDKLESQHTFTQMGHVSVDGSVLSFDVGDTPQSKNKPI
jgi:hypothetical protein